mgnify:CR=1 FL=1
MKKSVETLLLTLGFLLPQPSSAEMSWDDAIESVREKRSEYYEYATELGAGTPGTVLHGIGHDRHICAIVGRMLGFRDEIEQAETFDHPPLTPDANPYELMEHSMFLDSWVAAARRATAMTQAQKQSLWNLECPGNHGIPATARIDDPDLRGDFSVRNDKLVVYGDIDDGFHERFRAVLDTNPGIDTVALGSAGGSVANAILSGLEIRKRGLNTTLHGPCFSACPLMFAGGVERRIWMGPGPHMGFHRVYTASGEAPRDAEIYQHIIRYLFAMGVNPAPVLRWMDRAGSAEMFKPGLDQLCEAKVATWVQRTCGF